ncbi:hypothetical protein LZL87_012941 [Fusarium oxysporum]|nr:hypothetical protein LZL87_012941 [Fusarium oxysporum]
MFTQASFRGQEYTNIYHLSLSLYLDAPVYTRNSLRNSTIITFFTLRMDCNAIRALASEPSLGDLVVLQAPDEHCAGCSPANNDGMDGSEGDAESDGSEDDIGDDTDDTGDLEDTEEDDDDDEDEEEDEEDEVDDDEDDEGIYDDYDDGADLIADYPDNNLE